MIETDAALVGVEVKLWAGFQSRQPAKYFHSLRTRATDLQKLRRVEHYPVYFIVLAPDARREEVEEHLSHSSNKQNDFTVKFAEWENVLKHLNAPNTSLEFTFLAKKVL